MSTSCFNKLVGRRIIRLDASRCRAFLVFYDDKGETYLFETVPDCCNSVWVEHFNGLECLLGNAILSSGETEWQVVESDEDDVLETCIWSIKTAKGVFEMEVRNSHNGYYGGDIEYKGTITDLGRAFFESNDLVQVLHDS